MYLDSNIYGDDHYIDSSSPKTPTCFMVKGPKVSNSMKFFDSNEDDLLDDESKEKKNPHITRNLLKS